jgi:hypothetical protein
MEILSKNIDFESCILSQTDSTTAAGWLHKSNFADSEDEIVQMTTARHLATLIIESKCCLYSQWFPGDENTISDALSRDFHLSNHELSNLINNSALKQVPFGIEIQNLPTEISSWLTCLLRNQPVKEQWSKEPTRSSLYLGTATSRTSYRLDATKILSSKNFQEPNDTESWQPLPTPSKKAI